MRRDMSGNLVCTNIYGQAVYIILQGAIILVPATIRGYTVYSYQSIVPRYLPW